MAGLGTMGSGGPPPRRSGPDGFGQMNLKNAPGSVATIVVIIAIYLFGLVSEAARRELMIAFSFSSGDLDALGRSAAAWADLYRLATYALLHGSLTHVLFNAFGLMALGPKCERVLGLWRYLAIALITAIGGAIGFWAGLAIQFATTPEVAPYAGTLIGASGVVFGLVGVFGWMRYVMMRARSGRNAAQEARNWLLRFSAIMLGINLAIELLPINISGAAHIGGYLAGLGAAVGFMPLARRARR